ncbi:MAG: acylase [Pseudomonadota bacterium]
MAGVLSNAATTSKSSAMDVSPRIVWVLLITALFLIVGCAPAPTESVDPEFERLTKRAERVEIIRDDFGVPHIYAKTDADAVFGLLYAQAEDDFPRVERNYYWAIGRLAEAEGEDALMSDLRARLYMTTEDAIAAYESAPAWLKSLCDAFADGLNYYLATHPDVEPKVIREFEPWMPMFFFEGSIGGDIEQIPLGGIRAFYGENNDDSVARTATLEPTDWEPRGSNGFAISGEHTRSGNAMLLINPHTSFYFRGEVHVVSEQGLNAYGAVTWGQFFVYQGFNEHTGWMHTSTRVDFIDEFIEDVFEEDGELKYRYGDEVRPVEVREVSLKYRRISEERDGLAERSYTTYHTHHGPITHSIDGRWVATKINWDPVNALRQSYLRSKQDGHEGFREMMDIRTNSSNNTVYADSSGNIAYYHGNFVPRRDPNFDFSQPVDGSDPATDWQGLHTVDEVITVLNPQNGWLQNCNSTPFTAAGSFSPKKEDYPRYMAPDPENFRAVHALALLEDIDDVTLDGLIELAHDTRLPAFNALIPGLIDAFDRQSVSTESLAAAIDVLRGWDYRVASDSVAMTLAHFYASRFLREGDAPNELSRMDKLIYLGSETEDQDRLSNLAATLSSLESDYGSWNTPWGEINRFQRITGDIVHPHDDDAASLAVPMASGRWGALASYGAKRFPGTKKLYGSSGNSFVAVVEIGDKVRAKTVLAGGQSGDPNSPHFDDQVTRYLTKDFKNVAFYRDDVLARAERTYHPGE